MLFSPDQIRRTLLKHGFWFTGHTAIFRREYVVKDNDTDVWDPELYQFADHIVTMIAATKHGACFIPEILAPGDLMMVTLVTQKLTFFLRRQKLFQHWIK